MDINKIKEVAGSIDKEEVVSMFQLLKQGKYLQLLKEFLKLLWRLYNKYIKGKSITIKGKKIPLNGIIARCLFYI